MRLSNALWAVSSAFWAAGCSFVYGDDLDARQCKVQEDCAPAAARLGIPLECRENVCRAPLCTDSTSCPTGSSCVAGECVVADGGVAATPCTQDAECGAGSRCGFDGLCYAKWGCLDQDRDWEPADATAIYRATVKNFGDQTTSTFTAPLTVDACSTIELASGCGRLDVPPADATVTETNTLSVPFSPLGDKGFLGAVRVFTAPPATDGGLPGTLPIYVHFTYENPLVSNLYAQTELFTASPLIFPILANEAFGSESNVKADPTKATVILQVYDCGGREARGVRMEPRSVQFDPQFPFIFAPISGETTPDPNLQSTTEDGAALLINLPATPTSSTRTSFLMRDTEQNRTISDTISLQLLGGALNYYVYYPRRSAVDKWMAEAQRRGLPVP